MMLRCMQGWLNAFSVSLRYLTNAWNTKWKVSCNWIREERQRFLFRDNLVVNFPFFRHVVDCSCFLLERFLGEWRARFLRNQASDVATELLHWTVKNWSSSSLSTTSKPWWIFHFGDSKRGKDPQIHVGARVIDQWVLPTTSTPRVDASGLAF